MCRNCQQHSRLRTAMTWAGTRCPGPGTAQGHRMATVHGFPYCLRCGRYSRAGLRSACTGEPTAHGLRMLSRLNGAPPMPPYGYKTWPDGTAARAEQRRHRVLSCSLVHGVGNGSAAPSHKRKGGPGMRGDKPPRKRAKARSVRLLVNLLGASPCTGSGRPPDEQPSEASRRLAALRQRVLARQSAAAPANNASGSSSSSLVACEGATQRPRPLALGGST